MPSRNRSPRNRASGVEIGPNHGPLSSSCALQRKNGTTTTIGFEAESGVVEAQLAKQAIELVKIEELDHEATPAGILGLLLDLDTRAQVLA